MRDAVLDAAMTKDFTVSFSAATAVMEAIPALQLVMPVFGGGAAAQAAATAQAVRLLPPQTPQ